MIDFLFTLGLVTIGLGLLLGIAISFASRIGKLERLSPSLHDRLAELEHQVQQLQASLATSDTEMPEVAPSRTPAGEPATSADVTLPATPSPPVPAPEADVAAPAPIPEKVVTTPIPSSPSPPTPTTTRRTPSVDLEGLIGGNWMARIGVLALVISLALAVGYSYAFLSPAGRIGIAYVAAAAILGGGLYLERRRGFYRYGRALIGGGWAAIYFTTYAMHGVEQARVIDSPAVGSLVLILAAAAMIAHSLSYGSELAAAMAFAVGFATLAISPMGLFALLATVLLAVVLLGVSYRFGWTRLALLGVVVSYGVYVFRGGTPPDTGSRFGDFLLAQATPLLYWLLFEAFDLVGRSRVRFADGSSPATRNTHVDLATALNTTAFIGVSSLQWLTLDVGMFDYFLPLGAVVFLASAWIRARVRPRGWVPPPASKPVRLLRGYEMALATATAFVVLAVIRRFMGPAEIVGLLLAGQLLLVAGVRIRDRFPRILAEAVFAVAILDLVQRLLVPVAGATPLGAIGWSPMAALTAALLLGNRFWLRHRGETDAAPGWLYSAAAATLVAIVLARQLPESYVEVGWLLLALLLLEAGHRLRMPELRIEAHALACVAWSTLFVVRVLLAYDPRGFSSAIGGSALLSFVGSARLYSSGFEVGGRARPLRACWSTAATLLFVAFVHQLLPGPLVAAVWAVMGVLLLELGYSVERPTLRANAALMLLLAIARVYLVDLLRPPSGPGDPTAILGVLAVIACLYLVAARAAALVSTVQWTDWEKRIRRLWLWLPAPALLLHSYHEIDPVSPAVVPAVWAILAGVFLYAGYRFALVDLRWHSYLASLAVVLSFVDSLPRTESFAVRVIAAAAITTILYACRLAAPATGLGRRGRADSPEAPLSAMQAIAATAIVTLLLVNEVAGSLLTVALALQGAATLVAGLGLGDRLLRLSGLGLLIAAVCKAFVYDLGRLAPLYRILSFLVLGLVLLAVSFLYTRHRERLRRLL